MFVLYRQTYKWLTALLLATLFFTLLILQGCTEPKVKLLTHSGMTMGTSFTVKWFGDLTQTDSIKKDMTASLVAINQSMSTYIKDSELSLINQLPANSSVSLSPELAEVLELALDISEKSAGAFDITVGPLVNLWGFGPDGRILHAPAEEAIEQIRKRVGFSYLALDKSARTLRKSRESYIDLSAIAKGYAVDQLARLLESYGVSSYLVEIGGELRAKGVKPDGNPWRIAVESPVNAASRSVQTVINVKDVGIATSGDYRNYFEENGQRFSHTIDPITGKPIHHRLASVTVLAPTCAEADALATTLMVMGPDNGYEFAVDQKIDALFIVKTDQGFVEKETSGFKRYKVQ